MAKRVWVSWGRWYVLRDSLADQVSQLQFRRFGERPLVLGRLGRGAPAALQPLLPLLLAPQLGARLRHEQLVLGVEVGLDLLGELIFEALWD